MTRKLLALLLALVLALSLCVPAFAAEEETDPKQYAAEMLYLLDLFRGTGTDENGEPVFALEQPLTREQAVTMLVRLLGKEEEALAQNLDSPFTDVAGWAKPYVGYAYAQGITNGTGPTTYSGSRPVTAAQYLTFLLRALGYEDGADFQWNAAWELTDELGITNGEYGQDSTFLRGDAALVSWDALFADVKDTGVMLFDRIFAEPEREIRPYEAHPDVPDYGVYVAEGIVDTVLSGDGSWYGYVEKMLGVADYTEALDECGFELISGFDPDAGAGAYVLQDPAAAAEDPDAAAKLAMQVSAIFDELLKAQPFRFRYENEAGTVVNILQCYYDGYTAMVLAVDTVATEDMLNAVKGKIDARAGEPLTTDAAAGFYFTGLLPVLLRQSGVYQPLAELSSTSRTKALQDLATESHENSLLLDRALTDALRMAKKYTELGEFVPLLETLQTLNAPIASSTPDASSALSFLQLVSDKAVSVLPALNDLNELISDFAETLVP